MLCESKNRFLETRFQSRKNRRLEIIRSEQQALTQLDKVLDAERETGFSETVSFVAEARQTNSKAKAGAEAHAALACLLHIR